MRSKVFSFALVLGLLVSGCGKKNESLLSANPMVGEWLLVKATWKGNASESDISYNTSNAYRFAADGSYQYNLVSNFGQPAPTDAGTYLVKDNALVITSKSGSVVQFPIIEQSTDSLVLEDKSPTSAISSRRYRRMSTQESTVAFR